MSTIELKQKITDQIQKIDDVDFLNGIVSLLENNSPDDFYELSVYQEERIEEARKQFSEGNTLTDEQVQDSVSRWLQSK